MTSFIWCQKFSFTIMVYSMTVSERTCHEDLKLKKFPKYVEPIKSYGTLNFEFPAILLPRIEQIKNSVNNFTLNRVIPENIHTPPVEGFSDCTPPPLRNFRSEGVFDDPLKKRPPQKKTPPGISSIVKHGPLHSLHSNNNNNNNVFIS